ncbi:hypothetical protein PV392_06725 [Streptomyces sp. ME03-5709C]|nr:hypothetical protein [Streptomyces sp. ME03-5709C]
MELPTAREATKSGAQISVRSGALSRVRRQAASESKTSWPAAGAASLELTAAASTSTTAASLPVSLGVPKKKGATVKGAAAGTAQVAVLGQKAARRVGAGVLLPATAHKAGDADVIIELRIRGPGRPSERPAEAPTAAPEKRPEHGQLCVAGRARPLQDQ